MTYGGINYFELRVVSCCFYIIKFFKCENPIDISETKNKAYKCCADPKNNFLDIKPIPTPLTTLKNREASNLKNRKYINKT